MKIRTDCRHYRVDRPCAPHKAFGARCESCEHYAPTDERVLVVKLDAMGDVLRTTSLLEPLFRRHPRAHVTWVTRANAAPLLAGNPRVDRVLTVESSYLELLLAESFDLVLAPDADPLAASIASLARAAEKRGFAADGRGGVKPLGEAARAWWLLGLDDAAKRANRRTYGEWLYAICGFEPPVARPALSVSDDSRASAERWLSERAPEAERFACVNTGASGRWTEKRWKARHYGAFVDRLAEERPDTAVVLVGGPGEAAFNAALLAGRPALVDGGTDNSVERFGALVAACDWILTPDSLGYHVACAVGTPAVCVVGPTSPWELDAYGTNRILHADFECIACYLAECPLSVSCMDATEPDAVFAAISALEAGVRA